MGKQFILALCVAGIVAGCSRISESRLNPFNWFGRSQEAEVVTTAPDADPRPLVRQIVSLRVEQVPGGAIVRATGLPEQQGYFDGALIPVGREVAENGALNYEFRVNPPFEQTRVSTPRSREVIVGRFVSDQTLAGAQQIRVSAAENALVVRR
ncbi:hypothetical protein AIOL_001884 [Candidatus Rhodobacter oscarellae]|uniref:Lipoprotein n=1 Tax=Candidatus Rhodobacter oscarellae TaxID=1675527 RepID=A0A0J9E234_9RHOB|nr:hypothetical protein [Candidatus Rhodobacter lobularis]KMW56926.1 hypothetical protein AIOL_001884 [Candidatus Rhodobacter lobularis]